MNFDTNVIGPANINLIGGGNGLQLQQGLLVLPLAITWSMLGLNHRRNRELKTLEVI